MQLLSIFLLVKNLLVGLGRPLYRLLRIIGIGMIGLVRILFKFLGRVRKIRFRINFKFGWFRNKISIPRATVVLMPLILVLSAGFLMINQMIEKLPDVNMIYLPPVMSSRITDRNGEVLYKFYINENRSWTPLGQIPQSLVWATLAIEDKNFYNHHGFSVKGILNAIIYNLKNGKDGSLHGGSTITQQLVKNVFLDNRKTWDRKFKELMLSVLVEERMTKDEILERYFNQVSYGGETYGVEEAAFKIFGKHVWEITMSEAAFLAGLPAAPSSYSPYGPNKELAFARQRKVLDEMVTAGYISKELAEKTKSMALDIKEENTNILAPHFVFYVKEILENQGFSNFERQGLRITTSLDLEVQKMAERIVREETDKVANLHIGNGAALVIDVKNGDILAMVGSKDYNVKEIDGKYNVTTALRQPGSSIKPINYYLALERGLTMSTLIDDSPVSYVIKGQKPYSPQNYNGKYMGRVTLRTALASSLNVPSVKLLAENGVDRMIDLGTKMGIGSWGDKNRFGLSLALGSGEVKMTELAGAYSIFANLGEMVDLDPILKIENYLGETVYEKRVSSKEVLDPRYSFLINDALSDNEARTPIFGSNSKLVIDGKTVAVKTGTTNNLRDNWCIGWTPSYLVSAWVGNNDNSSMSWVASGVSGATPIWNRIMREMLDDKDNEKWGVPMGIEKDNICGKYQYYVVGTEGSIKCKMSVSPKPTEI